MRKSPSPPWLVRSWHETWLTAREPDCFTATFTLPERFGGDSARWGEIRVRLFAGLLLLLAGQALLAAVLPGAVLVWNLDRGNEAYLDGQDRQALTAFTALTAA